MWSGAITMRWWNYSTFISYCTGVCPHLLYCILCISACVCVRVCSYATSAQVVYCSVMVNLLLLRLFASTYWHAPGWRNILPSNVVTNTSPATEHSAKKGQREEKCVFLNLRSLCYLFGRGSSPVQLFSVQFHTPPMHTLKGKCSKLTAHWIWYTFTKKI